jgi:hypothetical protein
MIAILSHKYLLAKAYVVFVDFRILNMKKSYDISTNIIIIICSKLASILCAEQQRKSYRTFRGSML